MRKHGNRNQPATCMAGVGMSPCMAGVGMSPCMAGVGMSPCMAGVGMSPCMAGVGMSPCIQWLHIPVQGSHHGEGVCFCGTAVNREYKREMVT